ncbi:DUF4350 domain-containing protein [Pedobacter faecalis]|uniref:DUF4350 domain-containing protein n=1 Tax=Pedobacter faecalis TaxID=3041495 RepID=UPI00254EB4E3|nr:DUF4350 domain-containing protein [Pedobacter sp. ELA7]
MNGQRLYFIGGSIFVVVYLLVQFAMPRPTDWSPTYLKDDKIPFGLYILRKELPSIFPGADIVVSRNPAYNTLKERRGPKLSVAYLVICQQLKWADTDFEALKSFIHRGNHVFIATANFGRDLSARFNISVDMPGIVSSGKPFNFTDSALREAKPFVFDRGVGGGYFAQHNKSAKVLARNEDGNATFLRYNIGKGSLLLLADPRLLSNFNFIQPRGADFVAKALSHVPQVGTVIWDENNTRGNVDNSAVLRVIFKYPSLRWAYWLAVSGLLLYVLFEMKRRQRVIPVIEKPANSTVDFVTTVGRVYYERRDNNDIALKKINYLLEFIRSRYSLKTNHINAEFAGTLAKKSGVPDAETSRMAEQIIEIQQADRVNDVMLSSLNKTIENFYKKAQ